jgi:hypothetical protein
MSSDWDADYGLSQGPIDSDKKLNIDLNAGLYAQEYSEYDLEPEDADSIDIDDTDTKDKKKKSSKVSLKSLKQMVDDLDARLGSLEKEIEELL